MLKKLKTLVTAGLLLAAAAVPAIAATVRYVEVRPTGTLQPGTTGPAAVHVSSGTIRDFRASTATVTGPLTANSATIATTASASSMTVTNNATVGTLTVNGASTLTGAVTGSSASFSGAVSVSSASVNGPTNVTGTLNVTGNTTLGTVTASSGTITNFTATASTITRMNGGFGGDVTANNFKLSTLSTATVAGDAPRFNQVALIDWATGGSNSSSSTASTNFINTNLSLTYTPKRADSSLIIIAVGNLCHAANGFSGLATISRDGTNLFQGDTNNAGGVARGNGATDNCSNVTMMNTDATGGTSAVTYRVQIRTLSGTGTTSWGDQVSQKIFVFEMNGLGW